MRTNIQCRVSCFFLLILSKNNLFSATQVVGTLTFFWSDQHGGRVNVSHPIDFSGQCGVYIYMSWVVSSKGLCLCCDNSRTFARNALSLLNTSCLVTVHIIKAIWNVTVVELQTDMDTGLILTVSLQCKCQCTRQD